MIIEQKISNEMNSNAGEERGSAKLCTPWYNTNIL